MFPEHREPLQGLYGQNPPYSISREEIGRFVLFIYLLSKEQETERRVLLSWL